MSMKAVAAESRRRGTPSTREMERINWMEFREWVPAKINTVLLPLGTMEPHGVAANGADILAPVAMARAIASRINAMIAPVIAYGFTGIMDAYPGSFTIPEEAYRAYVRAVVVGLATNKFKNIILLNGHGGGQTAILSALVRKERYKPEMATPIPPPNTWSAYPFPSSIMLYKKGQGYLKFDRAKAKTYFTKVNDKIAGLIEETIKKWEMAGL
jgi:creatinine amidohydrolase